MKALWAMMFKRISGSDGTGVQVKAVDVETGELHLCASWNDLHAMPLSPLRTMLIQACEDAHAQAMQGSRCCRPWPCWQQPCWRQQSKPQAVKIPLLTAEPLPVDLVMCCVEMIVRGKFEPRALVGPTIRLPIPHLSGNSPRTAATSSQLQAACGLLRQYGPADIAECAELAEFDDMVTANSVYTGMADATLALAHNHAMVMCRIPGGAACVCTMTHQWTLEMSVLSDQPASTVVSTATGLQETGVWEILGTENSRRLACLVLRDAGNPEKCVVLGALHANEALALLKGVGPHRGCTLGMAMNAQVMATVDSDRLRCSVKFIREAHNPFCVCVILDDQICIPGVTLSTLVKLVSACLVDSSSEQSSATMPDVAITLETPQATPAQSLLMMFSLEAAFYRVLALGSMSFSKTRGAPDCKLTAQQQLWTEGAATAHQPVWLPGVAGFYRGVLALTENLDSDGQHARRKVIVRLLYKPQAISRDDSMLGEIRMLRQDTGRFLEHLGLSPPLQNAILQRLDLKVMANPRPARQKNNDKEHFKAHLMHAC